jgi:hypothetical protein
MAGNDEHSGWLRQFLLGTGLLLVVALLIGGIVGVVVLGMLNVLGVGSASGSAGQRPTLYIPDLSPTTSPKAYALPPAATASTTAPSASPSASAKPKKPKPQISLQGFPDHVAPGQRISLTGTYPGGEGATLQVQQFQQGWSDFPVTATVSGGIFTTYVITSRTGPQRFRVVDQASGRHSNDVQVAVG